MKGLILRKANKCDVLFLVDVIVEAEKAGTNVLPYSTIFGLTEVEVRNYLKEILFEEMDGCGELSISNYVVAIKDNKLIAGNCAWIEGIEDMPTSILKGNLLNIFLPKKAIENAVKVHKIIHELHFDYKENTIFGSVGYVVKEFRGNGILRMLKEEQIYNLSKIKPDITEVYVDMFSSSKALSTNIKMGFKIVKEKESKNDEVFKYLPSNKKILLRKKI